MGVAGHRGVDHTVDPLAQPRPPCLRVGAPGHRRGVHPPRPPYLRTDQVARPELRPAGLTRRQGVALGIEGERARHRVPGRLAPRADLESVAAKH
ncbi:hypothetical protein SCOCK_860012 [Actinacidiphila cocklensis]|uniref:Uncharacterized protein n=1 Tax=Actinacidiphila cocklensis TaxID=887465 RepID=A0A9W4E4D6_9ACTN|nr:hypothetical protein SCOCK_860012 [Actinacidiphila cocklensis]